MDGCVQCVEKENAYIEASSSIKTKKELISQESNIDLSLIRCENHKDWIREKVIHEANFCSANFECGERGNFSRIIIADGLMNHPEDMKIKNNHFYFNYIPEEVSLSNPQSKNLNSKKANRQSRFTENVSKKEKGKKKVCKTKKSKKSKDIPLLDEFYSEDRDKRRKPKRMCEYSGDFLHEKGKRLKIDDAICPEDSFWINESFENDAVDLMADEELLCLDYLEERPKKKAKRKAEKKPKSFQDLANTIDKSLGVAEKFAIFLLSEHFRNYICLAHMGSKFDSTIMMEAFIKLGNIKFKVLH